MKWKQIIGATNRSNKEASGASHRPPVTAFTTGSARGYQKPQKKKKKKMNLNVEESDRWRLFRAIIRAIIRVTGTIIAAVAVFPAIVVTGKTPAVVVDIV